MRPAFAIWAVAVCYIMLLFMQRPAPVQRTALGRAAGRGGQGEPRNPHPSHGCFWDRGPRVPSGTRPLLQSHGRAASWACGPDPRVPRVDGANNFSFSNGIYNGSKAPPAVRAHCAAAGFAPRNSVGLRCRRPRARRHGQFSRRCRCPALQQYLQRGQGPPAVRAHCAAAGFVHTVRWGHGPPSVGAQCPAEGPFW